VLLLLSGKVDMTFVDANASMRDVKGFHGQCEPEGTDCIDIFVSSLLILSERNIDIYIYN
jgi:hypothetical protein